MFGRGVSTRTSIIGNRELRKYPLAPEFIAGGYADDGAAFTGTPSTNGFVAKGDSKLKELDLRGSVNRSSLSSLGRASCRSIGPATVAVDRLRPLATSAAARIE
jgi:hypothetical protein